MMALLKKDRIWLALALVTGVVAWGIVYLDRQADLWWFGAGWQLDEFLTTAWIGAFLLGLYAGLRDRLLGPDRARPGRRGAGAACQDRDPRRDRYLDGGPDPAGA